MTDNDRRILEEDGWTVDCESPFEISDADGNRATGRAAQYVLEFLKDTSELEWCNCGRGEAVLNGFCQQCVEEADEEGAKPFHHDFE